MCNIGYKNGAMFAWCPKRKSFTGEEKAMPSNTDQLRKRVNRILKWWRKQNFKENYYPVDELMALINEAIREAKIEESNRWLQIYYMQQLTHKTTHIDNLIVLHEDRIAELQKQDK